jgi:NAD(P) transhydrogenase
LPISLAGAALLAGWAAGRFMGIDEVTSATYLVSSALCIAAIACLSKQESARTGNALGLIGVSGGVVATLGGLNTDPGTYAQVRGSSQSCIAHVRCSWASQEYCQLCSQGQKTM